MTLDNLYSLAQSYVNTAGTPLVVLGSGSSIAHGLPSMGELADEFKKMTFSDHEDQKCFGEFLTKIETSDLESTLLQLTITDKVLAKIRETTWSVVNERDLKFFAEEVLFQSEMPLARLFGYLANSSIKTVNVVTTNYDRLAEYAANSVKLHPYTFFNSGYFGSFIGKQDDCYTKAKGCVGVVNVCKLHGSLDWFRIGSSVTEFKSIPFQTTIPSNGEASIITPGSKKFQMALQSPFRELFTISDQLINDAASYLCIGYGFNDEHVHPLVLENIRQRKKPLVVISKVLTDKARAILNTGYVDKVLMVEDNGAGGARVFTSSEKAGLDFDKPFWQLTEFLKIFNS